MHTALLPFQPVNARSVYLPIDARLTVSEANNLVLTTLPRNLILPQVLANHVKPAGESTAVFYIGHMDSVKVSLKRKYERGQLSTDLARNIHPRGTSLPDVQAAHVVASLTARDDTLRIAEPSMTDIIESSMRVNKYLWGKVELNRLITDLNQEGVTAVDVDIAPDDESQVTVAIHALNARILITDGETRVQCENEADRLKIKRALLCQLNTI